MPVRPPTELRCHRVPSPAGAGSGLQKRCYTSPFRHMSQTALNRCLSFLLFFTLTAGVAAQPSSPSPTAATAQSFVREILSRAGSPSTVAVSFQNVSLLPAETQETA